MFPRGNLIKKLHKLRAKVDILDQVINEDEIIGSLNSWNFHYDNMEKWWETYYKFMLQKNEEVAGPVSNKRKKYSCK